MISLRYSERGSVGDPHLGGNEWAQSNICPISLFSMDSPLEFYYVRFKTRRFERTPTRMAKVEIMIGRG